MFSPAPPPLNPSGPLKVTKAKVGELWKADPSGKRWQKRWFVLGAGKMAYYKNRESHLQEPGKPKGYFLVADIVDIIDRAHPETQKPPTQCGFYVEVNSAGQGQRTYYLCCQTAEERIGWCSALLAHMGRMPGPPP